MSVRMVFIRDQSKYVTHLLNSKYLDIELYKTLFILDMFVTDAGNIFFLNVTMMMNQYCTTMTL